MPAVFHYEPLCEWRHKCSQCMIFAILQHLHFHFPRVSAVNQRWTGGIRRVGIAMVAMLCVLPAFGNSIAQAVGPDEIVRQAVTAYKTRELNAKQYACIENDDLVLSHNGRVHLSDTYEVIPLGEKAYRLHRLHNGLPLPPQEERSEQQKLEQMKEEAHKFFRRKMEEAGTQSEIRGWVQVVDRSYQFWELNLETLPAAFDFTFLRQETLNGRNVFVIEGKPQKPPEWGQRMPQADVRNFDIKLWIDASEMEIIRVDASALNRGVWAQPVYALISKVGPGKKEKDELASVYETSEFYERGTLITMQWEKSAEEVWLLKGVHASGKVSWKEPSWINAATATMEQETTYSNYRKFRVSHRILPDSTE